MIQKIEMTRGRSQPFAVTLTDANYAPFVLSSGAQVVFGVKKSLDDAECVILKKVGSGTDGVFTFEIKPEDTHDLEPGRYFYDVAVQAGDDYFPAIETSPFDILPNVTKWGDGA